MCRSAFLLLFLNASFFSQANTPDQRPGWVSEVQVTQIVTVATGGINVRVKPELMGCVSQSGYGQHYASVSPSHPGLNLIQSQLLAAMLSGKKIGLYFTDKNCLVTEMVVYN